MMFKYSILNGTIILFCLAFALTRLTHWLIFNCVKRSTRQYHLMKNLFRNIFQAFSFTSTTCCFLITFYHRRACKNQNIPKLKEIAEKKMITTLFLNFRLHFEHPRFAHTLEGKLISEIKIFPTWEVQCWSDCWTRNIWKSLAEKRRRKISCGEWKSESRKVKIVFSNKANLVEKLRIRNELDRN